MRRKCLSAFPKKNYENASVSVNDSGAVGSVSRPYNYDLYTPAYLQLLKDFFHMIGAKCESLCTGPQLRVELSSVKR